MTNKPGAEYMLYIVIVMQLLISSCSNKKPVTLKSLLIEMTDRKALTLLPDPAYKIGQFSSYDRHSTGPGEEGWFANRDYSNFLGIDEDSGRREFVLYDHEGPGAVVRWWMTFAGEGSMEGIVRVYIDNNNAPVIEDSIGRVISGHLLTGDPISTSVSPRTDRSRRGHNLYLPIPYSSHCKITYECDSLKMKSGGFVPSVYYNITYREYETGTNIISFDREQLEQARALLEKTNTVLQNDLSDSYPGYADEETIQPGDTLELIIRDRIKALGNLEINLDTGNFESASRRVIISLSFDGTETVWMPLGSFFGTGYGLNEFNTWFTSANHTGRMISKWVMPFRKEARIRLINFGDTACWARINAGTERYRWQPGSMYFGAGWHEYYHIATAGSEYTGGTGKHIDINFVDITGMGVYTGDAITVYNTVDAWWGEGDEKIFIDGEKFPSCIGTGTEDYYGYAWCRPEPFSHPFIAQPTGEGNFHPGMTVNLRYRSLDAMPFDEMISSNIELWHWLPATINYGLSTFWYALPGFTTNLDRNAESVRREFIIDFQK